jgi:hypothetical protein
MLSPVTFEAKKQGRHVRCIFQRSGCKGNCGHVMGEVAVCYLVGTVNEAPRHRPVVERGNFLAYPGDCWFRNEIWSAAHRCEHTFCTCTVVGQNSLRPILVVKCYVCSLLHSHQRLPIRENKIGQGLDIRPISSHTFQQKLYLIIHI